uniref:60S ribosomal export protein NMD3 n=1 Tax=Piliocolobus tephrosceles TaxID=591936 RepID=A0A8C9LJJ8_9PRIM
MNANIINIVTTPDGLDFHFASRSNALSFSNFILSKTMSKCKTSKHLINHDANNNTYNYIYTFAIDICPICKYDLIFFSKDLATKYSCRSCFYLCIYVSSFILLVDPFYPSVRYMAVWSERYNKYPFTSLLSMENATTFLVLNVEYTNNKSTNHTDVITDIAKHNTKTYVDKRIKVDETHSYLLDQFGKYQNNDFDISDAKKKTKNKKKQKKKHNANKSNCIFNDSDSEKENEKTNDNNTDMYKKKQKKNNKRKMEPTSLHYKTDLNLCSFDDNETKYTINDALSLSYNNVNPIVTDDKLTMVDTKSNKTVDKKSKIDKLMCALVELYDEVTGTTIFTKTCNAKYLKPGDYVNAYDLRKQTFDSDINIYLEKENTYNIIVIDKVKPKVRKDIEAQLKVQNNNIKTLNNKNKTYTLETTIMDNCCSIENISLKAI